MIGSVQNKNTWAQRILPLCLCGFISLSMIAPASAQSNDVNNRLKRIENDVETLNRAVYKGEKPPASAVGTSEADALLQNRLNQIEKDLRELTGKVEEQTYKNDQLQQKVDAMEARLNAAPPPSAAAPATTTPAPLSQADGLVAPPDAAAPVGTSDTNVIPPTMPDGSPVIIDPNAAATENVTGAETGLGAASDAASLYEQGFAQIKAQDYPNAEKSFAAFMKDYPTHALAPNALYWLGETYYVRKDYDKAARTFAEAYQKYPKGPKGADNLLKLGLSLAGKGEKDNACIALGQLKKEYPKGPDPVLKRGEQEIATLGCK
jgi:tol-pal system protein YbgF